jgi:hypothetical protein
MKLINPWPSIAMAIKHIKNMETNTTGDNTESNQATSNATKISRAGSISAMA